MRFQDWKNEKLHNDQARTNIERAVERDWDVGKILVRVHVNVYVDHPPTIGINISTWRPQEGCTVTLANGKRCEGGYFDFEHRAFDVLTAAQLRIVAGLRAVVEQWVAGVRNELPDTTPYEAIKDEMLAEAASVSALAMLR